MTGLEVPVPLRITVETAMALGRPRRERELLTLGFVNGFQWAVCEPLKFHGRYYVCKHFFFFLREVCSALNRLLKAL